MDVVQRRALPPAAGVAARRAARTVFGLLGLAVGWMVWSRLYGRLASQLDPEVLAAVEASDAFGTIAGLAAVLVVLGPGLALSWIGDAAARALLRGRRDEPGS